MRHESRILIESNQYSSKRQAQAEEYERETIGQMTVAVYALAAFILTIVIAAIGAAFWVLYQTVP